MMNTFEEKKKEIETIKERTFNLKLSDADYMKIAKKAACAELSVESLLTGFIGDLVDGTYSHGSDERELAYKWYVRCGFTHCNNESFLHYLLAESDIEDFINTLKNIEECKKGAEDALKETEHPSTKWNEYTQVDGTPRYNTLDEYIQQAKQEYKDYMNELQLSTETLDYDWNSYLKWTDGKNPDREKEIEKVVEWYYKYMLTE